MGMKKAKAEMVIHQGEPTKEIELPASAAAEDAELVAGVVEEIRGILAKTVARGTDEVGRLLLREFFDDNPALYTSTSHTKHASLRLLLERCETMELPVRRTFLANSLQLAAYSRRLSEGSPFLQLPPSHRVELLRLGAVEKVENLAATAVEKNMTVQKIREVVRKEREKHKSTRGRKPTPEILRALALCIRAVRNEDTGRLMFRQDDVNQLTEVQRGELKKMLESLTQRLGELSELVG